MIVVTYFSENRFHLVDHDGLKFTDVAKTYSGVAGFMQCAYLLLMHTGVVGPLSCCVLCPQIGGLVLDVKQWEVHIRVKHKSSNQN